MVQEIGKGGKVKVLSRYHIPTLVVSCGIFILVFLNRAFSLDLIVATFFYVAVALIAQITRPTNYWNYTNPISLLAVLIFLFGFKTTNLYRELFIVTICSIFLFKVKHQVDFTKINIFRPIFKLFMLHLLVSVLYRVPKVTLQFLGYGYDNAFHLTVFRGYRSTNWFPIADSSNWWSDFELFKRTPTASSAVYSLFSNIAIGSNNLPMMEMSAFLAINLVALFSIIYIGTKIVFGQDYKKLSFLNFSILLTGNVAVILSTSGVMLANGFPPYLLVTLILVYWMHINFEKLSTRSRLMNLSLAAYSIILITPGPVLFLFLPGMYLLVISIKDFFRTREIINFIKNLILPITLATLSLTTFKDTSGSYGWRQILAPGGVYKPNLVISFLIFVLFVGSFLFLLKTKKLDICWLMVFSGGLSVAAFSILTYFFTGSIQYYAVKQLYIWLPLSGILLYKFFHSSDKVLRRKPHSLVTFCLSLTLILSSFQINRSESGFMGTLPVATLNLLDNETWKNSVVNADAHIQTYDSLTSKRSGCQIYRLNTEESDLNSRWANALTSPISMTESCFGGYWNSSKLSIVELIDKLENLKGDFLLILPFEKDMKNPKIVFPANVQVVFN